MDALADVLAATRTGGVLTSYVQAAAPWGLRMDDMPFAAFHVVAEGTCWLRPPGEAPLQLGAGDVVLLPRGSGHVLASHARGPVVRFDDVVAALAQRTPGAIIDLPGAGPSTRLICGSYPYDRSVAHPLLAALPPVLHIKGDGRPQSTDMAQTLRMLRSELDSNRPGARTIIDRLVDVLLVHIIRAWLSTQDDGPVVWLAALRDPTVADAIAFLHAEPARAWTVEELAAKVGQSRATLARRFTALVGVAPLAYLTRWRIELAARRLRDTAEPVAGVARSVGYASESAFSRAFGRAKGTAPGQYRAAHRSL